MTTLLGLTGHASWLVSIGTYLWIEPVSTSVVISILIVGAIVYVFAYGLYRDPGYRGLRRRSWE